MVHDNGSMGAGFSGYGQDGLSGPGAAAILVVDDDPEIRSALEMLLENDGHVVATAANGAEALQFMRLHGCPKLAIVDLQMPVMDGRALLGAMAKDEALARVPVVVISGRRRKDVDVPGAKAPFLPKPIDMDQLLAFVRKYTR
jgi:CheY-like chemotaxis protein